MNDARTKLTDCFNILPDSMCALAIPLYNSAEVVPTAC
jgi:hypothetical protein